METTVSAIDAVPVAAIVCSECDGVGTLERCVNGHIGNCPCRAHVYECEHCEGCGRLCAECSAPLPVCFPNNAAICRECANAEDVDTVSP